MPLATEIVGKTVENRHLVKEKDRQRLRDLLALTAVVFLVAAVVYGFGWIRVELIRKGYELQQMTSNRDSLVEENRRLRSKLARDLSLDQVDDWSRKQLRLTDPRPEQVIHVVADQRSADP